MRPSLSYPVALVVSVLSLAALRAAPAASPVELVAHDIDPKRPAAHAVNTADFSHDGKVDGIANSIAAQEPAWYENPSWTRHVVVKDTQQIVNQAMTDLDGDGIPELA